MLIEKLRKKTGFSETEKAVADYILNHGDDVIHMSIRELADACYTAPNTIMRLCKKLDFEGWRDFKVAYLREMDSPERDELLDVSRPFYIGQSTSRIARTMMNLQDQAIGDLVRTLNYADLEKAASILSEARTVFLYGHGDSMIRAKSFMNKMFKINRLCILATEAYEETGMSYNATKKDAAVFISYRGGNIVFDTCLNILKERGCPVIVLSAEFETALTKNCDIWLHIPDEENSADNIGTFYSQACFDYILNLLYCLVYNATYTKNHNHKIEIDRMTAKMRPSEKS